MTAFSGITFFRNDVLNKNLGGSFASSSNSVFTEKAFNGNLEEGWQSSGENSDLTTAYIERTLSNAVSGDILVIANHNLKNLSIYINDILFSDYTIKTEENFSVLKFNSIQTNILKIKVSANQTVVANSEKKIGNILLLTKIGQLEQPQEVSSKLNFEQSELTLHNGKKFLFETGRYWEFEMPIFSLSQNDIELLNNIRNLRESFYVWLCGGNTEQFLYSFEPYSFKNFIKVAVKGGIQPNLKDNLYWSGLRDKFKFVEVE